MVTSQSGPHTAPNTARNVAPNIVSRWVLKIGPAGQAENARLEGAGAIDA